MGLKRWIGDRQLQGRATSHAQEGKEPLAEQEVVAMLGPRRVWDPVNNQEHAQIARDMSRVEIEEYEEDLRRAEDRISHYPSPVILSTFLGFLYFAEWMGATMVIRALDVENPERAILGAMLATFAFFITYVTARAALPAAAEPGTVPGRSPWFYFALTVYGLFVLAVAALRVQESLGSEEGSVMTDIAGGLTMLFLTVGPAAVAEMAMRRLAPASLLARQIRNLRRRLREKVRRQRAGEDYVRTLARRQELWDQESRRVKALYERTYYSARRDVKMPGQLTFRKEG